MKSNKDTTLSLLQAISSRLSGRPDCRGVEYRVMIVGSGEQIGMVPAIFTYPDRYSRKESSKLNIVDFARNKLISEGHDVFNMSDGIYIYATSVTGKQRRWIRYDIHNNIGMEVEELEA